MIGSSGATGTAAVTHNVSEGKSNCKVKLHVEAFAPCPEHAPEPCGCPKVKIGEFTKERDISLLQFSQLIALNIFGAAQTIKDTSNSTHSETANTASGTLTVRAGTGTTAAAYNDYKLATETETAAGTIGAVSGSGVTSTFTITGTVTAGASRVYGEVGISVTVNTHVYLVTHDVLGTTLNVASGGTLAISEVFTFG